MVDDPNDGVQNISTDLDSESENSPETLSSMLSGVSSRNHATDVLALERQALERERLELERERLRFEKEKSKAQYSSISGSSSLELKKLELELEKLRLEQAKLSQAQTAPVINIINQNTNQNVNNSSGLAFVPPPSRTNNTTFINKNQNVNSSSGLAFVTPLPRKNNVAFIIGLIASFFGFFGVAHILNGRVFSGFGHMLRGFIWIFILFALLSESSNGGVCIVLIPLHIWFMIRNANRGSLPPATR